MLAVLSNRNILLLYWMATPIAAMNLAPALDRAVKSVRTGTTAIVDVHVSR